MDFSTSMAVAAAGMRAQSDRMKTIAENIANAIRPRPPSAAIPTGANRDRKRANSTAR